MQIRCKKCGTATEVASANMGDATKALPGWGFLWDMGNGLEAAWLCPACWGPVRDALAVLRDAFGEERWEYMSLAGASKRINV